MEASPQMTPTTRKRTEGLAGLPSLGHNRDWKHSLRPDCLRTGRISRWCHPCPDPNASQEQSQGRGRCEEAWPRGWAAEPAVSSRPCYGLAIFALGSRHWTQVTPEKPGSWRACTQEC